MIETIRKTICDFCKKEINTEEPFIECDEVTNEGCSTIMNKKTEKTYYVEDGYFCDITCLTNNIKKTLES